jgi:hypothetical protein
MSAVRRGRSRRRVLLGLVKAAAGVTLLAAAPALRRRGIEPREVAQRWGLKVVALDESDLRKPHDLAG